MSYYLEGVEQLGPEEFKQLVYDDEDSTIIIDVREAEEYKEGHIPGVPFLPMHHLPEVIDQFRKDYSYLFVCRNGSRSQHAALYFKAHGIENVRNYAGGMLAWDEPIKEGIEYPLRSISILYEA
ncbi:rhodanese-like domain-containing protein [Salsuginibacillus kocurii]|uniref:rhodanese-like domain-containing protein n=1 Tax=Salsuginibacillus kocurii TaxID=427078 RepID=UPI0003784A3B|nr:rhodanese-like domain-containing protein [Salsuginibacillus kocurii]